MRTTRSLLITAATLSLLTCLAAAPAKAQRPRNASPAGTIVGGVLGGTAGFFGGLYLGAQSQCYEICGNMVVGAVTGEILGLALGAHLGNGARGNFLATLGASAGVAGLGIATAGRINSDKMFPVTLVIQTMAVTLAEVLTSPRVAVAPMVAPSVEGTRVGLELRW